MSAAPPILSGINRICNELKAIVTCVICQDVINDPVDVCSQRHTFCRICIEQHAEYKLSCPNCRGKLFTMESLQVNRLMQANIEMYMRLKQDVESLQQRIQPVTDYDTALGPISTLNTESAARVTGVVQAQIAPFASRHKIFDAVKSGDEETVKLFIKTRVPVNQTDAEGHYPIFYAKTNSMIELLLRAGAKIKRPPLAERSRVQEDRFFKAISEDNLVVVKEILEAGFCEPETYHSKLKKVAFFLAIKNSPMMMLLFIRAGANLEYKTRIPHASMCDRADDTTPLFHLLTCIYPNAEEKIELLVREGANIHARGPGYTFAAHRLRDNRVASVAVAQGFSLRLLQLFLQRGANVNAANPDGVTALKHACDRLDLEKVNFLLDVGADVKDLSLTYAAAENRVDFMKHLISRGARMHDGPLHEAASHNHLEAVEFLLDAKANINAQDDFESTPLAVACQCGFVELVKLLIRRKTNLNLPNCIGQSPLLRACLNERLDVVQILIDAGADLNQPDHSGVTPLSYMKSHEQKFKEILAKLNSYCVIC